ncbi:MAG: response regulator [Candidatus Roseilinea sp.]|uniref:response regulator n=1 Tax=Candidatus Roseilinea sp. TaxID=2838777 RepID=UPI0040493922
MAVSQEEVIWTRIALERLFDLAFLRRHGNASCVAGRFADERDAQRALLQVIQRLKPPLNVPAHSSTWRIYNTLNLRYVQGLSQAETAAQLNIGSRQMRREQQRAIHAVAVLLFEASPASGQPQAETAQNSPQAESNSRGDFCHLDELLRAVIRLFDHLLERQRVRVEIALPSSLPVVRASSMLVKQLLVSSFNWLIGDVTDGEVRIDVAIKPRQVAVRMMKPDRGESGAAVANDEAIQTMRQLAGLLHAPVDISTESGWLSVKVSLPTDDARCILIIDDNAHAIQLTRRYLQQSSDFYLISVTDPREALRMAISVRPACILLDVMMPERDGWEILTLFRAHPEVANIPIVISSVLREENLARALGATAVLIKPFTATQLIDLLRSVTQPRCE